MDFVLTDLATALGDLLFQVQGLTFRGEYIRPAWTVQSGAPTHLLLTCSAYVKKGALPHFPPLPAFAHREKPEDGDERRVPEVLSHSLLT